MFGFLFRIFLGSKMAQAALLAAAIAAGVWGYGAWKASEGAQAERERQEERIRETEDRINEAIREPRGLDDALGRLRDFLR